MIQPHSPTPEFLAMPRRFHISSAKASAVVLAIAFAFGSLFCAAPASAQVAGEKAFVLPSDERLERAGLDILRGKHIILISDSKTAPLDDLAEAFDAAYPLWLAYFELKEPTPKPPPTIAFLVVNPAPFQSLGLWDAQLPDFRFGYAFPDRIWVYDQPISAYFRRHLLLHEGVHAFMFSRLNGCGPTWYMEGAAELLATHHWNDHRMKLPIFPPAVEEVAALGRLNTVREQAGRGDGLSVRDVLALRPSLQGDNVLYAWCWAFAEYLDGHPRWRARFRELGKHADNAEFMALFLRDYRDDWSELSEEWQVFTHDIEHGYDFERASVVRLAGAPVKPSGDAVKIAADRGWQSSGLTLEKGVSYTLSAAGRFQVAADFEGRPRPWISEPNGVSIRYYHGRPLGLLLGAVRPDALGDAATPLIKPLEIGLGATITPDETGVLYLRVNDSSAELADNSGEVEVKVARVTSSAR